MKLIRMQPIVSLAIGISSLFVPAVVWIARYGIIESFSPDDPVPQSAMLAFGFLFSAAVWVFGIIGAYLSIIGVAGMITGTRDRSSARE